MALNYDRVSNQLYAEEHHPMVRKGFTRWLRDASIKAVSKIWSVLRAQSRSFPETLSASRHIYLILMVSGIWKEKRISQIVV